MTKIINLFGGPGSGKSTTAARLFSEMKLEGYNVELVTEFAKQLTWQKRHNILENNQAYVHAKQLHYLDSVVGQVDYIVTDSPTLLSAIYMPPRYPPSFEEFVQDIFFEYDNINFIINRVKDYNPIGRNQTEAEAKVIDNAIKCYLIEIGTTFKEIDGNKNAATEILNYVKGL
jgi:adenylate kinase family enzyme